MSDAVPPRYVVRGKWPGRNGSSTYLCETVGQALKVLNSFKDGNYTDVEVLLAADGTVLSEAALISRQSHDVEASGGGPIVPDTLAAPIPLAAAA